MMTVQSAHVTFLASSVFTQFPTRKLLASVDYPVDVNFNGGTAHTLRSAARVGAIEG